MKVLLKPSTALPLVALLLTFAGIRKSASEGLSKNDVSGHVVHPCFNTTENHTVITPEGEKVLCLVPSEDDLMRDLEAIGGFNRHYVAVTKEDIEKYFEDPFDSKPIEWKSDFTGKRRRSIDEKGDNFPSDGINGQTKRGVTVGLQNCELKGTRTSEGYYQLCNECWWIEKLPVNKFPRYINEQICGKYGNSQMDMCNSYNGLCIQKELTQDLLEQTNKYEKIPSPDPQYNVVYKQVWQPYGQKIRSCCQCQNFSP